MDIFFTLALALAQVFSPSMLSVDWLFILEASAFILFLSLCQKQFTRIRNLQHCMVRDVSLREGSKRINEAFNSSC